MQNRARIMAAMSVMVATYLLFSTPSVRSDEWHGVPALDALPATLSLTSASF